MHKMRDGEEVSPHIRDVQDVLQQVAFVMTASIHTDQNVTLTSSRDGAVITKRYHDRVCKGSEGVEPMLIGTHDSGCSQVDKPQF